MHTYTQDQINLRGAMKPWQIETRWNEFSRSVQLSMYLPEDKAQTFVFKAILSARPVEGTMAQEFRFYVELESTYFAPFPKEWLIGDYKNYLSGDEVILGSLTEKWDERFWADEAYEDTWITVMMLMSEHPHQFALCIEKLAVKATVMMRESRFNVIRRLSKLEESANKTRGEERPA
jgi:hypothetical protein